MEDPQLKIQTQLSQKGLQIRGEVFDHGVYPTPPKLSLQNIVQLFQALNQLSNIENKISLDHFRENVAKYIPSMNQKDAEIYFLNYKLMVEDDATFVINAVKNNNQLAQNNINPQQSIIIEKQLQADVRGLSAYFFLQLYSISARFNQNLEIKKEGLNSQFNEGFRQNSPSNMMMHNAMSFSPLNSPRSKTTRVPQSQFNSDQEQQQHFIKSNIKTIMQLMCNDINQENQVLSTVEFNLLNLMLKPSQVSSQTIQQNKNFKNLSSAVPIFQSFNQRVPLLAAQQYIQENLQEDVEFEKENTVNLVSITKSVMTKDDESCRNRNVKISNCEDSYIYIDSSIQSVSIVNCVNTTIFIAGVQKIASIQKCENVQISVSANFLRIGNTIDSVINYYGSYPPIVFGDCRSITFAPSNVNYLEYFDRLRQAKIPLMYKSSQNFSQPIVLLNNPNINFNLQKAEDFTPIILPPSKFKPIHHSQVQTFEQILNPNFSKQIQQLQQQPQFQNTNVIIPLVAPNNYREAVIDRYKNHNEFQNSIKNSGLSEEDQRHLHSAIQGYFKDWLVTSGQIKPIHDLVKMIEE